MGAQRFRLIRQLLAENLLLALGGAVLGVAIAAGGLRGIIAMVPPGTIPDEAHIALNTSVLLFALGVSVAAALLVRARARAAAFGPRHSDAAQRGRPRHRGRGTPAPAPRHAGGGRSGAFAHAAGGSQPDGAEPDGDPGHEPWVPSRADPDAADSGVGTALQRCRSPHGAAAGSAAAHPGRSGRAGREHQLGPAPGVHAVLAGERGGQYRNGHAPRAGASDR